jgi:protein TonB
VVSNALESKWSWPATSRHQMEVDMFEQSVVEGRALAARPWTLAVSLAGQGILISAAIVMPLLHPEALQRASFWIPVTGPPKAYRAPAPANVDVARSVATTRAPHLFSLVQPVHIPQQIAMLQDPAPDVRATVGGPPGTGVPGGFDGPGGGSAVIDGLSRVQPPPVVPPPAQAAVVREVPKPAAPPRITVGGNVQTAKLISAPAPEYPPLAKSARVSGSVHLAALIGTDGRIAGLRMVDGHPLLVRTAMDAVKRWVYRPTLLNGDPVEVITEITVTFTLN